MKICHILPIFFNIPEGRGGVERVAYNLNEGLYALNPEIKAYACKNSILSGDLNYIYPVELNKYQPFKDMTNAGRGSFLLNHISNSLLHEKDWADIFQTHNLDVILPISPFISNKTVVTLHNPLNLELIEKVKHFDNNNIHFVTISQTQENIAKKNFKNVTTIYNGVEVDEIPFENNKEDYLIYVGRLVPHKGADIAIRSAIKANKKIMVVGKVVNRNKLSEEFFQSKVEPLINHPLVTHISEIDHSELYKLYAKSSGLLFPVTDPLKEPFGLVSTEAMASGTPVIGLDNSLMREIVDHGKTGFLVNSEDEIVDAISKLGEIKPSDCRDWVDKKFSKALMAKRYLDLYTSLVK